MKNILFLAVVAASITTSCSKEFTKKHEGRFKANGTEYTIGENGVSAQYFNSQSNKLQITSGAGTGGTLQTTVVVDLQKLSLTVGIDSMEEGVSYTGAAGGSYYHPVSGEWKITSHKEGNPASRHTEGTYSFVAVNPWTSDTVNITDGYFYVNNY